MLPALLRQKNKYVEMRDAVEKAETVVRQIKEDGDASVNLSRHFPFV